MTDLGYTLRAMTPEDYDQVYALWERIQGFALRSVDDSFEYVERFLRRNPTTSVVALVDGQRGRGAVPEAKPRSQYGSRGGRENRGRHPVRP